MNYQLVNVDVVRNQAAETTAEATVAEAGFGFSFYYAYAVIITTAVVAADSSAETAATIAANGLSSS